MTLDQKRAQASFKTRLFLHLAQRHRAKGAEGFTLVELMIVVAVIGVLSAVALPNFLQARNAAAAGSAVGEAIGVAKECATWLASGGIGSEPTVATGGPQMTCGIGSAGTILSRTFASGASGLRCLGLTTGMSSATQVTISVPTTGSMSCSV
jgi:type IV pilus assembly protein PilA